MSLASISTFQEWVPVCPSSTTLISKKGSLSNICMKTLTTKTWETQL